MRSTRAGASHTSPLLLTAFLLLAPSVSSIAGTTTDYYRWSDDKGNSHYGDTLPDEAREARIISLSSQQSSYLVEKVHDGDTITVRHLGKVRLLGINTPEVAHRTRTAEPYGDAARQRLHRLLHGKRVYLRFDQRRHDRFKRTLAHVTLEDGTAINELLLREGLARALFLQPNMALLNHYYRIEAEAIKARRGIWSLPEYRLRPATSSQQCIKHFCRLHGKVKKIEHKRRYSYLHLPGELLVAIPRQHLAQFHAAGVKIDELKGREITLRGWVGERGDAPYMKLEHPLQIGLAPP